MSNEHINWKPIEKIVFRFFFTFFILLILPLDQKFFSSFFTEGVDFFFSLFAWANYAPTFISQEASIQIIDLLFVAAISIIITIFWSWKQKEVKNYNNLYQLLRVVLRYKLAAIFLVYAFIKIFPLQIPFPTLSELNTPYGHFTPAKVFELTVGVAKARYQETIGLLELAAVLLLLFRRTATLGAITAAGILLNIVLAAFAYETGDQIYTSYLFGVAIFLMVYDLPRMYQLLLEKPVKPNQKKFILKDGWQTKTRVVLKSSFFVIGCFYAVSAYSKYKNEPYALPQTAALSDAYGFYNVEEFKLNNETIPYSLTHPERWKNVVFEKWGTLSIDQAQDFPVDPYWGGVKNLDAIDRTFESSGTSGRKYFDYQVDEKEQILHLQNKNKQARDEKLTLQYFRPDDQTIIISGQNADADSIHAVLRKVDKKYLLLEGRRKPIKL
jgi:hypothetical protein